MKKAVKLHIPVLAIIVILISVLIAGFAAMILFPLYSVSGSMGGAVGQLAGNAVGKFIGAASGMNDGINKGAGAGKADGLSAEDITVEIATVMDRTGSLEVLTAETVLYDDHAIGEEGNEKSETIYLLRGTALYTVDLENIRVDNGKRENEWTVYIPEPEVTFTIDDTKTEVIAQQQKNSYVGSAEDGYIASINARKKSVEEIREQMTNYDALMETAEDSAKKQVESLAYSVSGENAKINVMISGKEQS